MIFLVMVNEKNNKNIINEKLPQKVIKLVSLFYFFIQSEIYANFYLNIGVPSLNKYILK